MTSHVSDRCYQCGGTDDHPKVHIAKGGEVRTFHHDCLPQPLLEENDHVPHLAEIVEAARSGTRGAKLRAHIVKLHKEG